MALLKSSEILFDAPTKFQFIKRTCDIRSGLFRGDFHQWTLKSCSHSHSIVNGFVSFETRRVSNAARDCSNVQIPYIIIVIRVTYFPIYMNNTSYNSHAKPKMNRRHLFADGHVGTNTECETCLDGSSMHENTHCTLIFRNLKRHLLLPEMRQLKIRFDVERSSEIASLGQCRIAVDYNEYLLSLAYQCTVYTNNSGCLNARLQELDDKLNSPLAPTYRNKTHVFASHSKWRPGNVRSNFGLAHKILTAIIIWMSGAF